MGCSSGAEILLLFFKIRPKSVADDKLYTTTNQSAYLVQNYNFVPGIDILIVGFVFPWPLGHEEENCEAENAADASAALMLLLLELVFLSVVVRLAGVVLSSMSFCRCQKKNIKFVGRRY